MCNFRSFLYDLNKNTKVPFKIIIENNITLVDYLKSDNFLVKEILLGNKNAKLLVDKKFQECTSLLKYSIENKHKEFFYKREEIINKILNNELLLSEEINEVISILNDFNVLFLVLVEKNKIEVLSALNQVYNREEFIVMFYKDYILILGTFDDTREHTKGIKELINFDLYANCYISYIKIKGFEALKKSFKKVDICINLCKSYGLKEEIYSTEDLLFEKSIFSINEQMKNEIYTKFKDKFANFDNETMNTIQFFINCDLNISKIAKYLYIHRNTLIYRLDKLQKDTGYDIRNFKQATIFVTAFLIWKEKKYNEYRYNNISRPYKRKSDEG